MRRFRLKQPFLVTRALGCLALAAGVSTLGVALTVAVAAIPLLLFSLVFGASTASGSFALVLAFVTWIAVAGAVSVWALRAAGLILQHRIPAGYVALGDDGVCFRRFLRLRYVPWSAIESIAVDDSNRAVRLFTKRGDLVELSVDHPEVLGESVMGEMQRFRARRPTQKLRVLSADVDADDAWLARAQSALGAQGYRNEGVTAEDLAAIAEDPTQSPDQRVGAALALSGADDAKKRRVRVALQDCVQPGLSEAVDDALDADLSEHRLRRLLGPPEIG